MIISKPELKKSPFLHSESHVLADELSNKFNDQKHFAQYLKMALTHDHRILRRIAGEVMEQKAKNPGALFSYLVKKSKPARHATQGEADVDQPSA